MRSSTSLAEPETRFVHDEAPSSRHEALDPLYREHHRWLTGLLRLRYGREAAEDLVQETFLRAARRGPPEPLRHPRAWLLTIAISAARDLARRQRARPSAPAHSDTEVSRPISVPSEQDEAVLLKQVILSLPPHLQDVFLLSRVGGLTYEEIARRLGISIKTVEWRMSRALEHCQARLDD